MNVECVWVKWAVEWSYNSTVVISVGDSYLTASTVAAVKSLLCPVFSTAAAVYCINACISGQFLNDVGRHADAASSYLIASRLSPDDFELIFNTASALRCV